LKSSAQAELNQLQTAIENYKQTYGFYPPDNPQSPYPHPLLFELKGTVISNGILTTLDGTSRILEANLSRYNRSGLANSSSTRSATDDRPAPINFIREFRPTQVSSNVLDLASTNLPHLIFSGTKDPWRYRSSNPTNNPDGYDLWVDIIVSGDRLRISNWRSTPEILP
jgi:hypothetical protein